MVEYVWAIQRNDGKFLNRYDGLYEGFTSNLYEAWFYAEDKKWLAEEDIKNYKWLQNCKPVKIKVEVVKE